MATTTSPIADQTVRQFLILPFIFLAVAAEQLKKGHN